MLNLPVRHVRQENDRGCLAACIAMVIGATYQQVRQELEAYGARFSGEGSGITQFEVEDYLGERGYVWRRVYRFLSPGNRPRETWPLAPFAPVHVVGVRGAGAHGIVLMADGTVFDPACSPEPRRMSEYPDVGYMLGFWRAPAEAL